MSRQSLAVPVPRRGVDIRHMLRLAQPASGIIVAALAIEVLTRTGVLPEDYVPPVSRTLVSLVHQFGHSSYWSSCGNTLLGWAIGLGLAIVIAVPVGLIVGANEYIYRALRPAIEFLRPIPSVALIPLAILVYGSGLEAKVFLVTFGSVWPILVQTAYGAQDHDPVQIATAQSYRIRLRDRILHVTIPSAVPYIATGIRVSSSVAIILAITAELVFGAPGLGSAINIAESSNAVALMYALIITAGVLGIIINAVFMAIERRALRWHPSHREVAR